MQDISYASGKELERQFALRDELLVKISTDLKNNQLWLRRIADVVGLDENGNMINQTPYLQQQPPMMQQPRYQQPRQQYQQQPQQQEYLHPSIEIDNTIPDQQYEDLPVPPAPEEKKGIFGGLFKKKEEPQLVPQQPMQQAPQQPKMAPIQQQKRPIINKKPEDMTDEELRLHVFGE
jgi:hypothetical protein